MKREVRRRSVERGVERVRNIAECRMRLDLFVVAFCVVMVVGQNLCDELNDNYGD